MKSRFRTRKPPRTTHMPRREQTRNPARSSFRIEVHGRTRAIVQLCSHHDALEIERRLSTETDQKSLGCLGGLVLDRALLEQRLALGCRGAAPGGRNRG